MSRSGCATYAGRIGERPRARKVKRDTWQEKTRELVASGTLRRGHLLALISAETLREVGFTAAELLAAGFALSTLRAGGYKAQVMRAIGLRANELGGEGYTPAELKGGGFSAKEMRYLLGSSKNRSKEEMAQRLMIATKGGTMPPTGEPQPTLTAPVPAAPAAQAPAQQEEPEEEEDEEDMCV